MLWLSKLSVDELCVPFEVSFLCKFLLAESALEYFFLEVAPHVIVELKQVDVHGLAQIALAVVVPAQDQAVVGLVALLTFEVKEDKVTAGRLRLFVSQKLWVQFGATKCKNPLLRPDLLLADKGGSKNLINPRGLLLQLVSQEFDEQVFNLLGHLVAFDLGPEFVNNEA